MKLNKLKKRYKKQLNRSLKKFFIAIISTIAGGIFLTQYDRIIDGDTFKIKGETIRLYGIDAPEKKQICHIRKTPWNCGVEAKEALKKIMNNRKISCTPKSKDKYGRMTAICYADTTEINKSMVRLGYALAYREYSKQYIPDEEYAKNNKLGIWQGSFDSPKDYRK
ncbi:MAG: thermonuclease family protein [Alphaproteobacteria bacterium]